MGGYGFYVWGSYGVAFLLLAVEVLTVVKRKRALARAAQPQKTKLETPSSKLEPVL